MLNINHAQTHSVVHVMIICKKKLAFAFTLGLLCVCALLLVSNSLPAASVQQLNAAALDGDIVSRRSLLGYDDAMIMAQDDAVRVMFDGDQVSELEIFESQLLSHPFLRRKIHQNGGFYTYGQGDDDLDLFLRGSYGLHVRSPQLSPQERQQILSQLTFQRDHSGRIVFAFKMGMAETDVTPLRLLTDAEFQIFVFFMHTYRSTQQQPWNDGSWAFRAPGQAVPFEDFVLYLYYPFQEHIREMTDPSAAAGAADEQSDKKRPLDLVRVTGEISTDELKNVDDIFLDIDEYETGQHVICLCGNKKHVFKVEHYEQMTNQLECPLRCTQQDAKRFIVRKADEDKKEQESGCINCNVQ